jgi:HAE1 family hydrophobic/amphiphilic exporter-1
VLHAYWVWIYARDFLAVQRQSLAMAQALLDGNRQRVAKGAMAAVDVIEAEAEVARRAEAILTAEKNVANTEERLRLHIFDPASTPRQVVLEPESSKEVMPVAPPDTTRALTARHDLKALRIALAIDAIDLRRFRNDALPEVIVGASYALRGTGGRPFSSVIDNLTASRYPSWSVELGVSYPIGVARSEVDAARVAVQRRQREAALRAAEQRVVVEVDAAAREVETNFQRLETSATAVALAERRLDAEQRKFASGLSTSFFVFQAQRDLSQARESQLRSLLDHHLATVDVEAVQVIPLDVR